MEQVSVRNLQYYTDIEKAGDIFCMDLNEKHSALSHLYNHAEYHKEALKSTLSSLFETSQV